VGEEPNHTTARKPGLLQYSSFNTLWDLVYLVWSGGARTCGGVDGIHVDDWHLFEQNLGGEKLFEENS
jgi:hypothetical protein